MSFTFCPSSPVGICFFALRNISLIDDGHPRLHALDPASDGIGTGRSCLDGWETVSWVSSRAAAKKDSPVAAA